ncbi:uncharacterized protein LOC122520604 [Polistes fuscatus]|uniref:uncharacterized protein LOC122520604 n=1 Tax=Polistes fuscatus TaxID=30207 RepID=UPI001CA818E5|nr:uncharacterized protein LOC122520604 [Polistes fuscatus]
MLLFYIINLDRSSRTTTPLSVKKLNDGENCLNYLKKSEQLMNFNRNKQISQPSLSTPLKKTKTPNDENKMQIVDENTSSFFKEINLLLDQNPLYKQSQMNDNTFANTTLKQKLFNAMCTTKFGKTIDVETLAKNNKLGEVSNVILSDWLYKHSIPHNRQSKKADLIEKVLEKIRSMKKYI